MDDRIRETKCKLISIFDTLQLLYPGILSVGSPFYICKRKRIATKIILPNNTLKCVQVGKLLFEARIGRRLVDDETVDHIDGDPLNDDISNLQLLDKIANCRKGPSDHIKMKSRESNRIAMTGRIIPYVQGSNNKKAVLCEREVIEIKTAQLLSYRGQDRKLAIQYGVSRETISAIRRGLMWNHISAHTSIQEADEWKLNSQFIPKPKKIRTKHIVDTIKVKKAPKATNTKSRPTPVINYCKCGNVIKKRSKRCVSCTKIDSRKFSPSKEELQTLVNEYPLTEVGKKFGVSDNAVKKRCINLGVVRPTIPGYWAKKAHGKI